MTKRTLPAKTPPKYCEQCGQEFIERIDEAKTFDVLTGKATVTAKRVFRVCMNDGNSWDKIEGDGWVKTADMNQPQNSPTSETKGDSKKATKAKTTKAEK